MGKQNLPPRNACAFCTTLKNLSEIRFFSDFKNICETLAYKYMVNLRRNILLGTCTESYAAAVNVYCSVGVKEIFKFKL